MTLAAVKSVKYFIYTAGVITYVIPGNEEA